MPAEQDKLNISLLHIPSSVSEKRLIPERQYTDAEVIAINRLMGVGGCGVLNQAQMPDVIDVMQWWKQTAPVIWDHATDRELFIGWGVEENGLIQAEVTEGIPFAGISQNPSNLQIGRMTGGEVVSQGLYPLEFHTHTDTPQARDHAANMRKGEPVSSIEDYLDDIPRSSFNHLSRLLLHPELYAMVVVDISKHDPSSQVPFPVKIIFKTAQTPVITSENRDTFKGIFEDIFMMDYYRFDTINLRELLGRRHRARFNDIRLEDRRWTEPFHLAYYRGYVSFDAAQPQPIRRSDTKPTYPALLR